MRLNPPSRQFVCTALLAFLTLYVASCKSSVRQVSGGRGGQGQVTEEVLVVAISPRPGRIEVGPRSNLRLSFSAAIAASSLGEAPVTVRNLSTLALIPGTLALEAGGKDLVFTATSGLPPSGAFSLDISTALQGVDGGSLGVNPDPAAPRLPAFYATFSEVPQLRGTMRLVETTGSSIAVAWDAATDNSSLDGAALTYQIFVAALPDPINYSRPPARETLPGALTEAITRLEPGVEYRLALRASDALGNLSSPSNEVIARTRSTEDRLPPSFDGIARLEVDPLLPTTLGVFWEPGQDQPDPGPLRYNVYVALNAGEQDFEVPSLTTAANATAVVLEGLSPNTEHFVVVRAMDAAGNEEENLIEATVRTPASFKENVFKILTLPAGYDASLCWPPCTNFRQPGGCARGGCHTGGNPAGRLSLQSYEQTVASRTIVPGDPARSQFVFLLRTTTARRMPRGGTCNLGEACIQTIERWIADGALNN